MTGAGPLRTAKRGDTLIKNTTPMDMDNQEETNLPAQRVRMTQGAARNSDIVPVGAVSSSDNGPSQALPASARLENTLAEEALRGEEPVNKKEMDKGNNIMPVIPIEETDTNQIDGTETASTTSASAAMECDEHRATKRKISRSAERYSSEDSEDENLKRVKMVRRRRIFDEKQSKSNPDLTTSIRRRT